MIYLLIVILYIGTLSYIYFENGKRDKVEKERFREFVLAIKSKDVEQYSLVLPPDENEEMPIQENLDLVPLEEMDPEELLRIKQ